MNAALLVLLAIGQAAAAPPVPAAQPGEAAQTPGTASDASAEATIIYELGERQLNAQENWTLKSASGKTIPASEVRIPLPPKAKLLRLDEKQRSGFRAREDSTAIEATEPLGPQSRDLTAGYLLEVSGTSVEIERTMPFATERSRVVIQEAPGLTVTTNVKSERRTRDLGGHAFAIYDLAPMPSGTKLQLTINGLPARSQLPRRLAMAAVVVIVGWMLFALATRSVPRGDPDARAHNPVSARARRDQLVKALEVLERDFKTEQIKEKRYQRRRDDLMKALAAVLREVELESAEAQADFQGRSRPTVSNGG